MVTAKGSLVSMTDLDTQKREKWHSGLSQIGGIAISGYIYPNPGSSATVL